MQRTRSVLIDATVGTILRNVSSINTSNSVNVIAGNRLTTRSITGGKSVVRPTLNVGGKGMFFIAGASVTQIILSISRVSKGSGIQVVVKQGLNYQTSSVVGSTLTLPADTLRSTHSLPISIPEGNSIFFDIVSIGSTFAGAGLTITVAHYTG